MLAVILTPAGCGGEPRSASEAFSAQNASESECPAERGAERHGEDE